MARVMHARLGKMFSSLLSRREVSANPVRGVARPKPWFARRRVLTDDAVRAFWRG